jgi:hypothetical protein
MCRALHLALAVLLLGSRVGFPAEQTVEPIVPAGQQEIEPITPPGEQVVNRVGAGTEAQQIQPQEARSPAAKAAYTASKVVTGVAAAGAALGAMAAMLLFF